MSTMMAWDCPLQTSATGPGELRFRFPADRRMPLIKAETQSGSCTYEIRGSSFARSFPPLPNGMARTLLHETSGRVFLSPFHSSLAPLCLPPSILYSCVLCWVGSRSPFLMRFDDCRFFRSPSTGRGRGRATTPRAQRALPRHSTPSARPLWETDLAARAKGRVAARMAG